jgi:hypothetical protein
LQETTTFIGYGAVQKEYEIFVQHANSNILKGSGYGNRELPGT